VVRTQIPHDREYFEGVEERGMSKPKGDTNKNTHAYFSIINKINEVLENIDIRL